MSVAKWKTCQSQTSLWNKEYFLAIQDILRSVLQQRDAFGLQGISHRYKLNTNKAELEPLPEHERVVIEYR